jgi:hypothetical protein
MNKTKGSLPTDHSSSEADIRKDDQGIFHIWKNIIVNSGIYNILLLAKNFHSV